MSAARTLTNTNTADAKAAVNDLVIHGDPDTWRLLCKASSKNQRWMKSTKAMAVPGGVVIQTETREEGRTIATSQALVFVPDVVLTDDGRLDFDFSKEPKLGDAGDHPAKDEPANAS